METDAATPGPPLATGPLERSAGRRVLSRLVPGRQHPGSVDSGRSPSKPNPLGIRATRPATAPLLFAAALFALGVSATHAVWIPPSLALIALILTGAVAAVAAAYALRIAWLPLAVLWFLLGNWCAEMEPQPAPAAALGALSDGLARTIEGTITAAGPIRQDVESDLDAPVPTPERPTQSIEVRLSSAEVVTDDGDEVAPVSGSVRLTVRWGDAGSVALGCGERVRLTARLLEPPVYHDAGAWNRAEYLLGRGITATASVEAASIQKLAPASALRWSARASIDSLRCALLDAQRSAATRLRELPTRTRRLPAVLRFSEDDAVMLSAMITGDRTFLTHPLRVGFERTGSFHMLVVSGFHLAIVTGCIFWVARALRLARLPATLLTMVASAGYALFTGFGTPVQRSLCMVLLYLLGRVFFRERSRLNVIGFAALCLLVASPRSLFDAGFQMTLLAVLSIAGIAAPLLEGTLAPLLRDTRGLGLIAIDVKLPPRDAQFRVTLRMLARRLQAISNRTVAWTVFPGMIRLVLGVAELLVVSVVVELAMALPMAQYFHRITLAALPVNLLLFPLLLVLVPAAILTLVVLLVWPAAAVFPGALTALLLHLGVGIVRTFGSLAKSDWRIPQPAMWQVLACVLLLAFAVLIAGERKWRRRVSIVCLALASAAALLPRSVEHPRSALLFEAIDVGQGDSLLLVSPEGKTLLVDGGGLGGGPRQSVQEFDVGEEVVSAALWARGVRHLDTVALTHAHADHIGGLPSVLRNFHPAELWVGKNPPVEPYRALLSEAAGLGVNVRPLRAGDVLHLGSLQVHILAPFPTYVPGAEPANNDSLVMRVSYGETSILLEGDAEAPVEQGMIGEQGLSSTVLKVGHHGSVSSSTPAFLERVAPRWAVISCGLRNRYGHPRAEVLEELQRANVRTFSTDINGAVCFQLDGKAVTANPGCE